MISSSYLHQGKCLNPCKTSKYYIKDLGFISEEQKSGIIVNFDRKVEKTISELQIGTQTLITRFGGIIGVGKNLLWVIILLFSSVGFCAAKAKNRKDVNEVQNATSINSMKLWLIFSSLLYLVETVICNSICNMLLKLYLGCKRKWNRPYLS